MIEALEPPSAVDQAQEATEVMRAWVVDEHLEATLDPLAFEEAGVWGALLADLARHVANTWSESTGENPVEIYRQIVDAFNEEADATAALVRSPADSTGDEVPTGDEDQRAESGEE